MLKVCTKHQCSDIVVYSCSCADPPKHFCKKHFTKHAMTPGRHLSECLIISLTDDAKIELLSKVQEILKHLDGFECSIMRNAETLISSVEAETLSALKNIGELRILAYSLIPKDECVNKVSYEMITHFRFKDLRVDDGKIDKLNSEINNVFKFSNITDEDWKECDQVILPGNRSNGGLMSIDLNTFKLSHLDFAPKINKFCHASKIDNSTYFVCGDFLNGGIVRGETYLINLRERRCEILQNGPAKCAGGSVLKDSKVYVFGGGDPLSLNTCDTYDLKTKEWKLISPLPVPCFYITTVLLDKAIILSGQHMNCCYSYDDYTYKNILNLVASQHKIVFEGWILCGSILYENHDKSLSKWTSHKVDYSINTYLIVSTTFKNKQHLYFITQNSVLVRLDTNLKKLEIINYS